MIDPDFYRTVKAGPETLFKDRGSKFFGYARPCEDEQRLQGILEEMRVLHPKARHHCYAARFGFPEQQEPTNDAGEPAGTAGLPILHQIKSHNLDNAAVVVVRYFGGTKLGKSGLIQAYKASAEMALEASTIIHKMHAKKLTLEFGYELSAAVNKGIASIEHCAIEEQSFTERCEWKIAIPKSRWNDALNLFSNIHGVNVSSNS